MNRKLFKFVVWLTLLGRLAGTLLASLLTWVPGLHVYSLAGIVLWTLPRLESHGLVLPPQGVAVVLL